MRSAVAARRRREFLAPPHERVGRAEVAKDPEREAGAQVVHEVAPGDGRSVVEESSVERRVMQYPARIRAAVKIELPRLAIVALERCPRKARAAWPGTR